MKVLVAGAHGKTARRLVRILTEDGHEVQGLVRKEEQMPDVEADGAEPFLVDLEEAEVEGIVGRAVEGCDAIVFAAGAGPGSGAARKETMDYGGAVKLVEAAEVLGRRGEIPRDDVARTFAEALEMPNTYRKTFEIIGGETPIREALERI